MVETMVLLPAPPSGWASKSGPVAVATIGATISVGNEKAGRAYDAATNRAADLQLAAILAEQKSDTTKGGASEDEDLKKRLLSKYSNDEYYMLLGLGNVMFDATTEMINANYAKASIILHPDKANADERHHSEQRFKMMKKAWETLSDPAKRAGYDSSIPFDDSTPGENQGKGDKFYKVFGPVFERNGRFSMTKPVPKLGDENTSHDDVNAFYSFWLAFQSWRDFSYLDEHKFSDGDSREDRRFTEAKNKKERAVKKAEETKRVNRFVQSAMNKDPRIAAMKVEAEAEKQRVKDERAAIKRQKAEAEHIARYGAPKEEPKVVEEVKIDPAEAKRIKNEKEQLRKMKSKIRKLIAGGFIGDISEEECEALAERPMADLQTLQNALSDEDPKKKAANVAMMKAMLASQPGGGGDLSAKEAAAAKEAADKAAAKAAAVVDPRAWTAKEEEVLATALKKKKKFPECLKEINLISAVNRTIKEIMTKAEDPEFKKRTA